MALPSSPASSAEFTPKLVSALREGYSLSALRADALAGLTVAIVALPLSMAIAIASGVGPERGLFTAIVGGLLISAFGGSRHQIGGPAAAFIVVVFASIEKHGYAGFALATFMAGLMLLAAGRLRLGDYVKYVPYPVITGFTAGIAVSIFVTQIKDLLGLTTGKMPGEFLGKLEVLAQALPSVHPGTVAIAGLGLVLIVGIKRLRPGWPNLLIAVAVASAAALLVPGVATIGSTFGAVPRSLPAPSLPPLDPALAWAVLPDAITFALLGGIESLLSAVVADGMTGRRHRSNAELVAQGLANMGSALFGGLTATGTIARTATNIRSGARTPVAGMLHAVFLLLFMLLAAPALAYVPLAALAAVLTVVAWGMADQKHVLAILRGSWGDRVILVLTFGATVLVDLTLGIQLGMVTAAFLFMHRMAESVEVAEDGPEHAFSDSAARDAEVALLRIEGPFFFGSASRIAATLDRIGQRPKAFVLDFEGVPFIDSTAAQALLAFAQRSRASGIPLYCAGVRPALLATLEHDGIVPPLVHYAPTLDAARDEAHRLIRAAEAPEGTPPNWAAEGKRR